VPVLLSRRRQNVSLSLGKSSEYWIIKSPLP
jgi:hypothetical protein